MYGMDKEEIQLAVEEHRRCLATEIKASMTQQALINRQWRRWLSGLGLTLIACGQRLATWSTKIPTHSFHKGS